MKVDLEQLFCIDAAATAEQCANLLSQLDLLLLEDVDGLEGEERARFSARVRVVDSLIKEAAAFAGEKQEEVLREQDRAWSTAHIR